MRISYLTTIDIRKLGKKQEKEATYQQEHHTILKEEVNIIVNN